jgi:EAL domain-containing protein (putative c-di-GMP-specific phosphodiesterase class I)/ActR/RegA family two-component response regulator
MSARPLLIVDDDLPVCLAITEAFVAPWDVMICRDIESAEMLLEKTQPSHVVSDVRLTGPFRFEGLDFVDHVRSRWPGTPVILMTGNPAEGLEAEALRRGVIAVLAKPFAIEELEQLLGPAPNGVPSAPTVVPTMDDILSSGEMTTKFQPIVSLADERLIGYESLARLPGAALLSNPEMLFRYAARKGRVIELELACLARSLETAALATHSHLLFVNMHPDVFADARLAEAVGDIAERFDVGLDHLIIEITEQQRLVDQPSLFANLDQLRAMGVRFAIDDFGVAYSHLTLIEKIEPAFLKVSQDFGTDFEKVAAREKIVRNVQSLARDFGAQVILEGIESAATAAAALERGLAFGQGYHFGRPADLP